MTLVLATERLAVHRWTLSDIEIAEAFRLWSDARVMRFVGGTHESETRTRAALEAGPHIWRLALKESQQTIGACGFYGYDGPGSQRQGANMFEMLYHLFPERWGAGYATEVGAAMVDHAFTHLGATHVVALIDPRNVASLRTMEKLSFRPDGEESGMLKYGKEPR